MAVGARFMCGSDALGTNRGLAATSPACGGGIVRSLGGRPEETPRRSLGYGEAPGGGSLNTESPNAETPPPRPSRKRERERTSVVAETYPREALKRPHDAEARDQRDDPAEGIGVAPQMSKWPSVCMKFFRKNGEPAMKTNSGRVFSSKPKTLRKS